MLSYLPWMYTCTQCITKREFTQFCQKPSVNSLMWFGNLITLLKTFFLVIGRNHCELLVMYRTACQLNTKLPWELENNLIGGWASCKRTNGVDATLVFWTELKFCIAQPYVPCLCQCHLYCHVGPSCTKLEIQYNFLLSLRRLKTLPYHQLKPMAKEGKWKKWRALFISLTESLDKKKKLFKAYLKSNFTP